MNDVPANASVTAIIGPSLLTPAQGGPGSTAGAASKTDDSPQDSRDPLGTCSADDSAADTGSCGDSIDATGPDATNFEVEDDAEHDSEDEVTVGSEPSALGGGILKPRQEHRHVQRIELIVPAHAEPWVVAQVMSIGPQALLLQLAGELTASAQLGFYGRPTQPEQCARQPGMNSERTEANESD